MDIVLTNNFYLGTHAFCFYNKKKRLIVYIYFSSNADARYMIPDRSEIKPPINQKSYRSQYNFMWKSKDDPNKTTHEIGLLWKKYSEVKNIDIHNPLYRPDYHNKILFITFPLKKDNLNIDNLDNIYNCKQGKFFNEI